MEKMGSFVGRSTVENIALCDLAPVNAKLLNQATVWPAQLPTRLGQCFRNTWEATTLAFSFLERRIRLQLCEDGPRAGLVTNRSESRHIQNWCGGSSGLK